MSAWFTRSAQTAPFRRPVAALTALALGWLSVGPALAG